MPGEGDSNRRPAGPGAGRALHRLRRVLQGVHPVGQARGVGRRRRREAPGRPRPRGRHHRAQLSGRVHRPRLHRRRRHPARARLRFGPRGGVRRRTGGQRVPAPRRARYRTPLDRHHLPGRRRLRGALLSRPHVGAGPHRLAHGRNRAPASPRPRPRPEDRLRGPVHREEARDGRTGGRGGRGADLRGTPRDDRRARDRRADRRRLRVRPAAQPRRRAVPHQRRHAAGRRDPGGPGDRPRDGGRRARRVRTGDQGGRVGPARHEAARGAVLPRLHDGPGHEHRPAALRPPRAREPVRAPPHRRPGSLRVAGDHPVGTRR